MNKSAVWILIIIACAAAAIFFSVFSEMPNGTAIFIMYIIIFNIFFTQRGNNRAIIARKTIKNKRTERTQMVELAKNFIGKECLITSFEGGRQYGGIVKEVSDGAVLLEKDGKLEAINLDFVIRIREFPRNKKGKKKAFVLD